MVANKLEFALILFSILQKTKQFHYCVWLVLELLICGGYRELEHIRDDKEALAL